jgi:hypothetical protein
VQHCVNETFRRAQVSTGCLGFPSICDGGYTSHAIHLQLGLPRDAKDIHRNDARIDILGRSREVAGIEKAGQVPIRRVAKVKDALEHLLGAIGPVILPPGSTKLSRVPMPDPHSLSAPISDRPPKFACPSPASPSRILK